MYIWQFHKNRRPTGSQTIEAYIAILNEGEWDRGLGLQRERRQFTRR